MKQISLLSVVLIMFLLIALPTAPTAPTAKAQSVDLTNISSEFKRLFQEYYPQIKSEIQDNHLHFEYKTRYYLISLPTKTGIIQEPRKTAGPRMKGILCHITLEKGKYQGTAALPQKFPRANFTVWLLAPYSA